MEGGRILGEGVDGCVLAEPMWPCAPGTTVGTDVVPNPKDSHYVSKIVPKGDAESGFLRAANRILGPQLADKFLAAMKSECSPANSSHPPVTSQASDYEANKVAVLKAANSREACGQLKKVFKQGKGITNDMKVLHISRYPMTCVEWVNKLDESKHSIKSALQLTITAIPTFLTVLQKLVSGSEQLVHIDLHTNNIFVRPFSNGTVQFGIADFGHCFLRQRNVVSPDFFGKYLCEYIPRYEFFSGFSQVPLEARLLNFCYQKRLDNAPPSNLSKGWALEVIQTSDKTNDTIIDNLKALIDYLHTKPLFIAMLEQIQVISKKIRTAPTDPIKLTRLLTPQELTIVEYILTRYTVLAPINTITQTVFALSSSYPMFDPSSSKPKGHTILNEFIIRCICAPYEQGSSLSAGISSVMAADLNIAWTDVVREFS